METIKDILDWLQCGEDNGINTVGTQNVKRHLESVQKHQKAKQKHHINVACGSYKGYIEFSKIETNASDFDWRV